MVECKTVGDLLIAGIRFQGDLSEIPAHFQQLRTQVEPHITGQPMVLYHWVNPAQPPDKEVSYPVATAINTATVQSRQLEGGAMITMIHDGPLTGEATESGSLRAAWRAFGQHMRENEIGIASGAGREVYLSGDPTDGTGDYLIELQMPVLLPRWLDRLADGLAASAGDAARVQVNQGADALNVTTLPCQRISWVQAAMERLDAAVADDTIRHQIMYGCAHRFPPERIAHLREEYQRLGSIDALLDYMKRDDSWKGASFYAAPERQDNTIYVVKVPWNAEGMRATDDKIEKRANYCHCALMREAIRQGEGVSPTFCYCGAGWYTQLWEGILGQPVQVEVLNAVLQGDTFCKFAITLPAGV